MLQDFFTYGLRLCTVFLLVILFSAGSGFAQGCSDAGFCTMGAMKPNQHFSRRIDVKLKSIEIGGNMGYTHFNDVILTYVADFNFAATRKLAVQVKVPYMMISGPLAKTDGLSDISIALTHSLIAKEKYSLSLTAGTKIPVNDADKKQGGKSLPMYYQTSLGTYDLIVGASLFTKKWLFATGYQQPLNKNASGFFWGAWNGDSQIETVRKYPVALQLYRGTDVMFRVERNFRFSRVNLFTGLLPIYRLTKDEITDPASKKRVKVEGSDGLALTFLNGFGYRFSAKSSIKLLTGIRLVKRETNPDGLSREFVVNLSYLYRF